MSTKKLSPLLLATALTGIFTVQADLFVTERYFETWARVLRFDETTGEYLGETKVPGEGLLGVTYGGKNFVYAVENTVGYGVIHRIDAITGDYLGEVAGNRFVEFSIPPLFPIPTGLTIGPGGDLFLLSWQWANFQVGKGQVFRIDPETGEVVGNGPFIAAGAGGLLAGRDLEFQRKGNVFVADASQGVLEFDKDSGAFVRKVVSIGQYGLSRPEGLAFDRWGRLYVSDYNSGNVLRFAADGSFLDLFATTSLSLRDIEFGRDGDLYAAAAIANTVVRIDGETGAYLGEFTIDGAQYFRTTGTYLDPGFGPGGLAFAPVPESATRAGWILALATVAFRRRVRA